MFETRLKIVLGVFGAAFLLIFVRLIDLQIVRAAEFRRQAEQALLRPARMLPFVRGRILDRLGTELAADEPCWEIAVDYGVLAMEPGYLRSRARRLRRASADRGMSPDRAEQELVRAIDRTWSDLSRFTGETVADLRARAELICARVRRVRAAVAARRGFDAPVAEERMGHALVAPLNDQQQVSARKLLRDYPWIEVRDATYRRYHPSASLPHILGQLGAASAATLDGDPERDDPLARYLGSEALGVSGVELAAERRLRGRRGLRRRNRDGETVENIPAVNGQDTTLTLRLDLQEPLYQLLAEMIPRAPHPSGGAVVVLDVPTREVLAMVSYPGYDGNTFHRDYDDLAGDTRRQPLRFRAVANRYAPGSIVKPLTCIAGLSSGKITLDTTFDCKGYYHPETRSGPKCWRIHGTDRRTTHGPLTVSEAIAHSCNIFMYHTGELVGVDELCNFFDMAGIGRPSGIGLREEARGINPTPNYLESRGRAVARGDARNFAIGQGEVCVTPLQAANLMAVYASGVYRPVTLIREESILGEWRLPVAPEHWRAIRAGVYRVANQPGATAYRYANFVRDGYALCGKTGSATVWRWRVSFAVPYTTAGGGRLIAVVPATRKQEAIERFVAEYGAASFDPDRIKVSEYWPQLAPGQPLPKKPDQEHAWFIGCLQAVDDAGRPMLEVTPRIAFSVLVEFGGSGGREAGPVARQVASTLLDVLGPELDPDATAEGSEP